MFKDIKDFLINVVKSRLFVLVIVFLVLFTVLIQRIFYLQIIKGDEYLNNFKLKIEKERTLVSTRGNIYDKNGLPLAHNKLAYSVTIEDNGTYTTKKEKNKALNEIVVNLIGIIEKNGDQIINNFSIVLNSAGQYEFTVQDTQLMRFRADVYGRKKVEDLKPAEKEVTAQQIIDFLCGEDKYDITGPYTEQEKLKILTIRYAIASNSYQKYLPTTVAVDVSEVTKSYIMENKDTLQGVSISEDSMRVYDDSEYFAQLIGYTGKISTEEYEQLKQKDKEYALTDIIGKSGIEQYMETDLQGIKGYEKVYVDNMGKVIEKADRKEPKSGNDLYLTIDKNLQEAVYKIIERRLAGILYSVILDIKTFTLPENGDPADIKIPIDDVYFAMIDNNILDVDHFMAEDASSTEQNVHSKFVNKQESAVGELMAQLSADSPGAYKDLPEEMQIYMSYIVNDVLTKGTGILMSDAVDKKDPVFIKWTYDETISLREYLTYAISKNWIDMSKISVEDKYLDSGEIYQALIDYLSEYLKTDKGFSKKLYKYMIRENTLSGREVCLMLYDQKVLPAEDPMLASLQSGAVSPYHFMKEKIKNLEITPAQLALTPCNGSAVVTDVRTGEVLACVTYPGYDNNKLANTVDSDYYSKLTGDGSAPLLNHATQERTAPGSTFKPVTTSAGLEEKVVGAGETIVCTGTFDKIVGQPTRCWKRSGHGPLNLVQAIENSCNYYFDEIGYRLSTESNGKYNDKKGLETLKKYAEQYGLGAKSGIELDESKPQISDKDAVRSSIGQGTHIYTTTQIVRYISAVANKGTVYDLTLLGKLTDPDGNLIEDYTADIFNTVDVKSSTWDAIHQGMRDVILKTDVFNGLEVELAGKTGTAQENKQKPNHALFVGYAPASKPEIAMTIRIANGFTSTNTALIADDIMKYYYELGDANELINGTAALSNASVIQD